VIAFVRSERVDSLPNPSPPARQREQIALFIGLTLMLTSEALHSTNSSIAATRYGFFTAMPAGFRS